MSKLIVIVGATGTQGSSVARTFLDSPGWRVRGLSRNPSSEAAKTLSAQGIDMVKADLNDKASIVIAFKGAHTIFGVTDFWAQFLDPVNGEKANKLGITPNEVAYDVEVQHGINIATAAAETESLNRFVISSLADVKKWSKGKYTWVYHFDSKAAIVDYIKTNLPDLAAKSSYLQVGEYMTNWKKTVALGQKKLPDGSFIIRKPHSGSARIPMIWVERDTGKFIKALVEAPPGKTMLGYGSLIGWEEYIKTWAKLLGVEGRFEQISADEYLKDWPENLGREIREGHLFHGEYGWDGQDPEVQHPRDFGVEGTPVEEYIRGEDWSSLLKS